MATCVVCKKSFDVSNMGESALTSHAKGVKHLENAEQAKNIQKKNPLMSEFLVSPESGRGKLTWLRRSVCCVGSVVLTAGGNEQAPALSQGSHGL